ncbi:hypothetical protein Tco_0632807 [Tanacetum coccineum]
MVKTLTNLESHGIHEGRSVLPYYYTYNNINTKLNDMGLYHMYNLDEPICPRFVLEFYSSVMMINTIDILEHQVMMNNSSNVILNLFAFNSYYVLEIPKLGSGHFLGPHVSTDLPNPRSVCGYGGSVENPGTMEWGGRGVTEKHSLMVDKERSGVEPSTNKDGVAPSVTVVDATPPVSFVAKEVVSLSVVDETMAKEKQSPMVNITGLGSSQETNTAGNAPGKSSYANVTSKPSVKKLNLHTLFTPGGNGIDVVVPVESIRVIRLFSFQFSSIEGLDAMLENVWVKLHGVPVTEFNEDGMSAIATKLAMIELRANVDLKDNIMAAMPKITKEGYYTCNIRVEYEWKPPRCACCKVFCHVQEECPKNIGTGETKNLKKTSQNPKGISVGQRMGFRPTKLVFQLVSKKPTANTSVNIKKNVEPTKEFWTVDASSPSSTPIFDKIDKIEKLNVEGKATLVDNEGKPLEKVSSSCEYDSEDKVASVNNDMASFLAKKDGYGTQSLVEEWTKSYENDDYGYDPYDDDMYEGHDIPDKL